MAEIKVGNTLWDDIVAVARRNRERPERLAERALRDYLAHVADEGLLARSEKAAQRKSIRVRRAEAAIKQLRANSFR